ncbi:MAG: Rieske (2Fe-2S) protein [Methanobacteriota archaeon]
MILCHASDMLPGRVRGFEIEGRYVVLANDGGRLFALDGICTHQYADLAAGRIEEGCLVCPRHRTHFRLEDGEPVVPPADRPLRTYPVRIDAGLVVVDVPSL